MMPRTDARPGPSMLDDRLAGERFCVVSDRANVGAGHGLVTSGRVGSTRLAFAPLAGEAATSSMGQLAEMIGVTRRTIYRWARDGVPASKADRAAIAVGSHPAYVWVDEWATS